MKPDGGQAFPMPAGWNGLSSHEEHSGNEAELGMSLRDYFFAKLMQGFAANPAIFATNPGCGWKLVNATEDDLVGYACSIVDRMLKARED
jgi:hypothetical protein